MLVQLIIFGVVLLAERSAAVLRGELCNQCMGNNVACLDATSFATCFNGSPTENVTPCTAEKICTQNTLICVAKADVVEAACTEDNCGDCQLTEGHFACVDEIRYGFCFGGLQPDPTAVRSCIEGYVCNHNSLEICGPAATVKPSCTPATIATTTPATTTPATTTPTTTTPVTTITAATTLTSTTPTTTTMTTATPTTITMATTTPTPITPTTTTPTTTTSTTTTPTTITLATTTPTTTTPTPITPTTTTPTTTTSTTITPTTITLPTTTPTTTTPTTTTTTTTTMGMTIPVATSTAQAETNSSDTLVTDAPVTTSTPNQPLADPTAFCARVQREGKFRRAGDSSCKKYILCYLLSGQYLGLGYICSGYFDATIGECQIDKPVDCR